MKRIVKSKIKIINSQFPADFSLPPGPAPPVCSSLFLFFRNFSMAQQTEIGEGREGKGGWLSEWRWSWRRPRKLAGCFWVCLLPALGGINFDSAQSLRKYVVFVVRGQFWSVEPNLLIPAHSTGGELLFEGWRQEVVGAGLALHRQSCWAADGQRLNFTRWG